MGLTPLAAPHQPHRGETHRVHDSAVYLARESGPLLLVLLVPLALVIYVALEGLSREGPGTTPVADFDAGFRYEAVGTDVRRLVDDGAGHYPGDRLFLAGPDLDIIAFEPDGSPLLCCDDPDLVLGQNSDSRLIRLGQAPPVADWDDAQLGLHDAAHMDVSMEGDVWLSGPGVAVLESDGWTTHLRTGGDHALEIGDDGTVWADVGGPRLRILQLHDGEKRIHAAGLGLPAASAEWAPAVTGIVTTPDGAVWVGVSALGPRQPGGLLRFDGERWKIVRALGQGIDARVEGLAVAPDGTLWSYLSRDARDEAAKRPVRSLLARYDGKTWSLLRESDGVPYHGPRYGEGMPNVLMAAGPDDAVWLTPLVDDGCRQLVLLQDGEARRPLGDVACVEELELDSEGTAWVVVEWRPARGAASWRTELLLVSA